MRIEFEFATRDDCLAKMVPSNLRCLIKQRDDAEKENKILREIAEKIEHEYEKDPDFRSFFLLENIRSFAQDKLKEIE